MELASYTILLLSSFLKCDKQLGCRRENVQLTLRISRLVCVSERMQAKSFTVPCMKYRRKQDLENPPWQVSWVSLGSREAAGCLPAGFLVYVPATLAFPYGLLFELPPILLTPLAKGVSGIPAGILSVF